MPSRIDIQNELMTRQDSLRRQYLKDLKSHTKRNVILYATAFTSKNAALQQLPGTLLSITTEDIQGFMSAIHGLTGDDLDIIIHSPGGSAEATEQIVSYLRLKFKHIRAIIPQNAMSAATMLACACNEIILAKHSAMGPIDPQMAVTANNGSRYFIPAQSILDEFEQAKNEVISNPEVATLWVNRINQYPHGFLRQCEDLVNLSKTIVGNWLDSYMFADKDAGQKKGASVANWLGDAKEHKSHGRPLQAEELKSKGLNISYLESDQTMQELVLSLFHATMLTFDTTTCVKIIENHDGKGMFSNVAMQQR